MMNVANFMTLLRILAIPVFIAVYYADFRGHYLASSLIFILACVTDWLDGYLARKLDQCTPFGAFLDPVADKILVTVALVMLAANFASPWFVIPAAIMVAREILISALREWMAENNQRNVVAVGYLGKVKNYRPDDRYYCASGQRSGWFCLVLGAWLCADLCSGDSHSLVDDFVLEKCLANTVIRAQVSP